MCHLYFVNSIIKIKLWSLTILIQRWKIKKVQESWFGSKPGLSNNLYRGCKVIGPLDKIPSWYGGRPLIDRSSSCLTQLLVLKVQQHGVTIYEHVDGHIDEAIRELKNETEEQHKLTRFGKLTYVLGLHSLLISMQTIMRLGQKIRSLHFL